MALNPSPSIQFHSVIEALLREWKDNQACQQAVLNYTQFPQPSATLQRDGGPQVDIPLPASYRPYTSWGEWFRGFLEEQVRIIGEDVKLPVYVRGRKGSLILLERVLTD